MASGVENKLTIQNPVTHGYGDYLFYRLDGDRIYGDQKPSPLSLPEFQRLFDSKILPHGTLPSSSSALEKNDALKRDLQMIDPSIHATFIPRILLELTFLHRCIAEDESSRSICPRVDPEVHRILTAPERELDKERADQIRESFLKGKECWHTLCFKDEGDESSQEVIELAHRFNAFLVGSLQPDGKAFSFDKLRKFVRKECDFYATLNRREYFYYRYCHWQPGPSWNFAQDIEAGKSYGRINVTSLGIYSIGHREMIERSLVLECSTLAQVSSHILYRGASLERDKVGFEFRSGEGKKSIGSRSLSFGSGLFAGGIYDGTAAPFHYMRQPKNGAFAIALPSGSSEAFHVPSSYFLTQISNRGEFFHPRTRVPTSAVREESTLPSYCVPGVILCSYNSPEYPVVAERIEKLIDRERSEEALVADLTSSYDSAIRLDSPLKFQIEEII
jgi:hypothetical protein